MLLQGNNKKGIAEELLVGSWFTDGNKHHLETKTGIIWVLVWDDSTEDNLAIQTIMEFKFYGSSQTKSAAHVEGGSLPAQTSGSNML